MATFFGQSRLVKMQKESEELFTSFRRGINTLLQDVELSNEEFKRGDNLLLKGAGILTQRPGTANYFQAGSNKVRRIKPYYSKSGTKELLAFTDDGYFVKKNSSSYTIIPGASLPSGTNVTMAQIYDKDYIASVTQSLLRYDGTTLLSYTGISRPTNVTASKISGTSGVFTWGWRVSAESDVGETLASTVVQLTGLPEEFSTTQYAILSWNSVSNARGYAIYGRDVGNETFLTRIPSTSTQWIDDGNYIPSVFVFPPEADFTAGPKGKYVIAYKEKLVIANLENNPSRVVFSGGGPNVDKFHWSKGGGYIDVNKDDGEVITGIRELDGKIIVWKERSVYQITLTYNSTLGIVEPIVSKITGAIGSVSHETITQVENDAFFIGRRPGGSISLNALGYEPNFAQVLRTSEISARVRPEMETINTARLDEMWSIYYANKYWLFYPYGSSEIRCLVYDRERLAWLGPLTFPNNPSCGEVFYDADGNENFVYGDGDDGYVTKVSDAYSNDKGTNFTWILETKRITPSKDIFKLGNLLKVFYHFRNVIGTITINVYAEDKSGVTSSVYSEDIVGSGAQTTAGWGSFMWGRKAWGKKEQAGKSAANSADMLKYANINKQNIRSVYLSVQGTGSKADIMALKIATSLVSDIPDLWRL